MKILGTPSLSPVARYSSRYAVLKTINTSGAVLYVNGRFAEHLTGPVEVRAPLIRRPIAPPTI